MFNKGGIIKVPQESQYEILRATEAEVFVTFKFNHNVPKTMSMVNLLSSGAQVDYIPNQDIPISGIPELVFNMMNDECYEAETRFVKGFEKYNKHNLKFIVACPVVDEHRGLKGFSMLMFGDYEKNKVGHYMSQLRNLNSKKRKPTWQ
jgi:hypothetical protein